MCTVRLFIILAVLTGFAGCSLCRSHTVTGHLPELMLVAPNDWPELRMNTSEAEIDLRYAYSSAIPDSPAPIIALVSINKNGTVQDVNKIHVDDIELRERIRKALFSLRFYLIGPEINAASRYRAISNPKTDLQAPPYASQSGHRSLPDELSNVQVIVKFNYRDYEYHDNCWK